MRVYLARHGDAVSAEADPERPLSAQGREDVARVAGFLSLFERPRPLRILHSGKARAAQTASMYAEAWGLPRPHQEAGLAPNDDPSIWKDRLNHEAGDVMLVGHLPHLERLACLLLCGRGDAPVIALDAAGLACLERESEPDRWRVVWQLTPRLFRGE